MITESINFKICCSSFILGRLDLKRNYSKTISLWNTGLKSSTLTELHSVPYTGHPGFNKTLDIDKNDAFFGKG